MLFVICLIVYVVFFVKQKTAYEMRISDWSSDVCSSDLRRRARRCELVPALRREGLGDIGGIGTERTELVMLARIVIKTPADAPDVAGGHEARQRHVDRPTRPEVDEALGREHPAAALAAHALHDPIGYRRHWLCSYLLDNSTLFSNKLEARISA